MSTKEFQVELISRRRIVYIVRANDSDNAQRVAAERWRREDPGDIGGLDWSELEGVRVIETSVPCQWQDEELILRFIRERERLLLRLGNTFFSATINDAISAAQVAADLGWYLPESPTEQPIADTSRAARSLERLCSLARLICFERMQSRSGERGQIRLYCTPEYLEHLSDLVPGITVDVVR